MGYTVCQAQLAEKDMRPGGVAAIEFGGNDCDLDWKAVSENPDIYHEARTPIALFKDKLAEMVKKARAFDMRAVLVVPAAHRRGEVLRVGVEKPRPARDIKVSGRRAAHLPLAGALRAGGGGDRQQIDTAPSSTCAKAFLVARDFKSLLCVDGIHPTPEGHRLIWGAVSRLMAGAQA